MKTLLLSLGIAILFINCERTKKSTTEVKLTDSNIEKLEVSKMYNSEAYTLLKNNCYVCHNPKAESHDAIIAPPFKAVKMRYTMMYKTKDAFVTAVVNWAKNPTADKALMKGAVTKFNLMPKLPLDEKDLKKIATYLYENDVEEPVWMEEHMKEMQGTGMGKGMH